MRLEVFVYGLVVNVGARFLACACQGFFSVLHAFVGLLVWSFYKPEGYSYRFIFPFNAVFFF